ncbi:SDR family oxidoreductase [Aeromicrobium phragmitis]|uniref:SDR family oxidoreductase n=1 Tax=Aeromicrobium phragmitis TaxID=2478914 RepID=A0A3L8PJ91_9ACTN|nr:SDR family oxidoreductase [Aeromicrobium phragmitis]RLV55331.1 SDR family oxidoreductase [Aeromicrobium phragmitis]
MKLHDSVGIVTGAGGGIGAALCRRFVENGARVVATDLNADRLEDEVSRIAEDHPGSIVALAGDCSSVEHIRASIALAESTFDAPVDLYAANAGVGLGDGLDATPADWQTSIDVNLMAHVRAAELLVPGWLERGSGHFLSTASAAGLLTQIGSATYSTTKHAAVAFAEWLSVTYGARGIGVSCLCPMGVNTAMLNSGAESVSDTARQGARAVTEAGLVLDPIDVADIVVQSLATDEFLILPHPDVLEFFRRKASDYDRWLRGMRRYQETLS